MRSPALSRRAALLGGAATAAITAAPVKPSVASSTVPPVPRRILALYEGTIEARLKNTDIHRTAAMPLEWLGLTLEYRDVNAELPPIWTDPSYRGVLTWFPEPNLSNFPAYVAWIERVAASGLRIVQIGDAAPKPGAMPQALEFELRRRALAALGVRALGSWSMVTIGDRVVSRDASATEFEYKFDAGLPAYEIYEPDQADAASWLVVERADQQRSRSHLVILSKSGGFIAPGYAVGIDHQTGVKQWFVDPFAFFAAAFATESLPAPDTTTLCGRRLYYSHIDGDGWRSVSQVRAPGRAPVTNAEVVLQAVSANPDLPVTVAPIAAELDPAFAGDLRAIGAARAFFRLDHVEPATHTYTHPFRWSFFEQYSAAAEAPFEGEYRSAATGHPQTVETAATPAAKGGCCGRAAQAGHSPPRAFGGRPFDLATEIGGSARMIEAIAGSPAKRVRLLQWPGDCTPFPAALQAAAEAGLLNINGGDTRCDTEYPSVSAVAPLGLQRFGTIQIYASNSSEELYTDLWTDRYFGFRDLPETWDRTGAPRRLKPFNLYYHMYSGERRASLDALLGNLSALRQRGDFLPVFASRFAALAEGFFQTAITQEGQSAWRVHDRRGLQTIRFASGAQRGLDLSACDGVLGARLINNDLYVALDPVHHAPLVALAARHDGAPLRPYLVEAAWEVSNLLFTSDRFSFAAQGFGAGAMTWRVPAAGAWRARCGDRTWSVMAGADHVLEFSIPAPGTGGVQVALERDV